MLWKQVDEGRAVGEGNRREGFHVAQVVDLDEGIWNIMATPGNGEQEREGARRERTLNLTRL